MKSKARLTIVLVTILAVSGTGGYFYWQQMRHGEHGAPGGSRNEQTARQYTCPMHPFIVKDKPGACPICGMTLVPLGGGVSTSADTTLPEAVSLSPTQLVMANVATMAVEHIPLVQELRAVGIVNYDQARQAKVTAWVAGRLDRLYVNRVGDIVTRDQPVALIYAPELVSAQQEFLLALRSREEMQRSRIPTIAESGAGLVAASRQRLKLWGINDAQLATLEKSGVPITQVPISSPLSGVVVEKLVVTGQYVAEGDPLFNIADLSTIWVELAVYENELALVAVGQTVTITSVAYPGEAFSGKITLVYPFLDPQTRTVKVRVVLANPGLRLKPDMYVEGTLHKELGVGYAVPVTAVIDTGRRQVVWVQQQEGVFMPREVKIGARVGDRLQVLEGLDEFDTVAVSGSYLIDSEAQLRGTGAGAHAGHGTPAPVEQTQPAAAPAEHQH